MVKVSNAQPGNKEFHPSTIDLPERNSTSRDRFGFFLVLVFLCIEYGRPMDDFAFLKILRPSMIVNILLIVTLTLHGNLRRVKMSITRQIKMICLLIILLALHIPFAVNNFRAFHQTVDILQYMVFIFSIVLYVNTLARLKKFMYIWILLAVFLSIKGIVLSGTGYWGSSFLRDENDFSLLINMMIPFCIFHFMYGETSKRNIVYFMGAILGAVSVASTFSRGGFLGLTIVFGVVWFFSSRKVMLLFFLGVLFVAVYFFTDSNYWTEIYTIGDTQQNTAHKRLILWGAGWEMFKANPLGVGGDNFPVHVREYQPENVRVDLWGREVHSLWFTLLPELGILGVLIYGSLLFYNLSDIFWLKHFNSKTNDQYRYIYYLSLAYLASLAGYFTSGTFLSVLYYPHYFYITAMIIATKNIVTQGVSPSVNSAV